ncbi:MAG TPA: extensin family protein [Xanthobacteraceae bacterium]|nr:extensin family protein [Xanthobacteraceae bacterium]
MKLILCVVAILVGVSDAFAERIPLPRPRPASHDRDSPPLSGAGFAAPRDAGKPEQPSPGAPAPSACQTHLTADRAVYRAMPALSGPGECGAADVIELQAIVLADGTRVAVMPPAVLRCPMAEVLVRWVREDIAPEVADRGGLRALTDEDSYECRGQNRVAGTKLSEHGRADALDIHALRLGEEEEIVLTDAKVAADLREALRRSACARFTTVLGPGSDGYHEDHVHVDLRQRRNGYRICQWDLRRPGDETTVASDAGTVPLPRPRPAASSRSSHPAHRGL